MKYNKCPYLKTHNICVHKKIGLRNCSERKINCIYRDPSKCPILSDSKSIAHNSTENCIKSTDNPLNPLKSICEDEDDN